MAQRPASPSHAPSQGAIARLRPEIAAAVRLAALLGLVGAFGPFCLILLKMQIYTLVLPTGSMATAWGLTVGFALAAVMVVLLNHLRDLALIAIGHRVMRRLALPVLLAAASLRDADPAQAAAQALRDIEAVRRAIAGTLCAAALDAVLLPVLLLLMTVFHWAFAVFALVAALLALASGLVAERLTRGALAEANAAAAQGAALVAEAVRCAEAVEAMGMLPSLVRRWATHLARGAQRLRAAQAASRVTAAITSTLYGLASGGALIIGVLVLLGGTDASYGILAASC